MGVSPSANSSRSTGTTRCPAAIDASNSSRRVVDIRPLLLVPQLGRQRIDVEAGVRTGVARGPELLDLDQQGIAVAVEGRAAHILAVAARVSLAPVLLTAARPEGHPTLGEGAAQRLGIHVAEHEHLAGVVLLDHRGQQPVRIEHRAIDDRADRLGREHLAHRTITPSARSASLTWPTVSSPLWNTDA